MNSNNILNKNTSESFKNLIKFLGFANNKNFFSLEDGEARLKKFPVRLQVALKDKLNVDAVYVFNNKPVILFKTFDNSNEENLKLFQRNIWNFNESPIAFAVLPNEIRIYNAFCFQDGNRSNLFKIIDQLSKEEDFNYLLKFSSYNVDSGKIWEEIGDKLTKESRVDRKLLRNLKAARDTLNGDGLSYHIIHSLLGRCIFSRYLTDREALPSEFFQEKYSVKNFTDLILNRNKLFSFFVWLENRFNGDIFPLDIGEKNSIKPEHLKTVYRLFKGEEIVRGQISLFQHYDFSIIPIELISNIYEAFLTQENPAYKRKTGVFYTPLFLVDFILSRTLDEIIGKKDYYNVSILDPACGSGVFLVESFRRMVEKYIEKNGKDSLKKELKKIAIKNIYGIDKSLDAIRIAVFSLYIAMLDYIEPKDIAINGFQFPYLIFDPSKKADKCGNNFFVVDFFDKQEAFQDKKIFKEIKFDLIIGNPPWGTPEGNNHPYEEYCKQHEPPIPISDRQIAQAFLVRVKDFVKDDTEIALIVTSKILYNLNAKEYRNYLLSNFLIKNVLEFSTVRGIVFENAIGPGAVVFYKKASYEEIEKNELTYYALKPNLFSEKLRIIAADGSEVKTIAQKYFIEYDYLWKLMLYGNIFDFYFLKRLKRDYIGLDSFLKKRGMIMGEGLQFPTSTGKPKDYPELKDFKIIYTDKEKNNLYRYYVDYKGAIKIPTIRLRRSGKKEIYKAPHILIQKELQIDNLIKMAFSENDCVFTNSIIAISSKKSDTVLLKFLLGILVSRFVVYYLFHTSPAWGIERGELYKELLEGILINIESNKDIEKNIVSTIEQIEKLAKERHEDLLHNLKMKELGQKIKQQEDTLNKLVYALFNINDTERDLIDYTFEISIPYFNNKEEPLLPPEDEHLESYAKIFVDTFKDIFEKQGKSFQAEIYIGERYFVAMNFKVLNEKPEKYIIFKSDRDVNKIVKLFGYASFVKISQKLYIWRAIRGFEKSSFYIIKPNERKNWHRANARHDVNEFMAAMWDSDIRRMIGNAKKGQN